MISLITKTEPVKTVSENVYRPFPNLSCKDSTLMLMINWHSKIHEGDFEFHGNKSFFLFVENKFRLVSSALNLIKSFIFLGI